MNKFFSGFVIAMTLIAVVGCAGLIGKNTGVVGKSTQKQLTQNEKVIVIEQKEAKNSESRLTHIGAWSDGTKYALDKVPEPSKEVVIAKDINERVQALANKPNFDEVKEVHVIIDGLLSEMNAQQAAANISLDKKDNEISDLNSQIEELDIVKQTEIRKALKMATDSAAKADQYKQTLNDMDSFFGFGAIWYGLTKFVSRMAWVIGTGVLLFIILRLFSTTNPIVGSVFSIFNVIGGYIIRIINVFVPKAIEFSGHIATSAYSNVKDLLTKIVDSVQLIKQIEKATGKDATIKELFVELDKTMDVKEKDVILKIKKDLGYN
jgi:hypothetical protein